MRMFSPLPTVGASGVWKFDNSVIDSVNAQTIYSCQAITTLRDMILRGEDILNRVYKPLGLTEIDYMYDVNAPNVVIVTLVGTDNSFLRVPNNRILELPSIDGMLYSNKTIRIDLNLTTIDFDPSGLLSELKKFIYARTGIETEPKIEKVSKPFVVDYLAHEIIELERSNREYSVDSIENILRKKDLELEQLNLTVKVLEQFIRDKCISGELTGC